MSRPRQCDHPQRRAGRCPICFRRYQRDYWHATHPRPRKSARARARQVRRYIANGATWYIRKLLSQGTGIHPSAWREETVRLKRALITLKRTLNSALRNRKSALP